MGRACQDGKNQDDNNDDPDDQKALTAKMIVSLTVLGLIPSTSLAAPPRCPSYSHTPSHCLHLSRVSPLYWLCISLNLIAKQHNGNALVQAICCWTSSITGALRLHLFIVCTYLCLPISRNYDQKLCVCCVARVCVCVC